MKDRKLIRLCRESSYMLDGKEYTLEDAIHYLIFDCGFEGIAASYLSSLPLEMVNFSTMK